MDWFEGPTGKQQIFEMVKSLVDRSHQFHGKMCLMGSSINGGPPKWMVCNGKSCKNG